MVAYFALRDARVIEGLIVLIVNCLLRLVSMLDLLMPCEVKGRNDIEKRDD